MDLMEMMKWLTDEQKERFVALEKLYDSAGWKMIQQWADQKSADMQNAAANAGTWEENRMAVGQRIVYDQIVTLQESALNEFEQLAQEAMLSQQMEEEEAYE